MKKLQSVGKQEPNIAAQDQKNGKIQKKKEVVKSKGDKNKKVEEEREQQMEVGMMLIERKIGQLEINEFEAKHDDQYKKKQELSVNKGEFQDEEDQDHETEDEKDQDNETEDEDDQDNETEDEDDETEDKDDQDDETEDEDDQDDETEEEDDQDDETEDGDHEVVKEIATTIGESIIGLFVQT